MAPANCLPIFPQQHCMRATSRCGHITWVSENRWELVARRRKHLLSKQPCPGGSGGILHWPALLSPMAIACPSSLAKLHSQLATTLVTQEDPSLIRIEKEWPAATWRYRKPSGSSGTCSQTKTSSQPPKATARPHIVHCCSHRRQLRDHHPAAEECVRCPPMRPRNGHPRPAVQESPERFCKLNGDLWSMVIWIPLSKGLSFLALQVTHWPMSFFPQATASPSLQRRTVCCRPAAMTQRANPWTKPSVTSSDLPCTQVFEDWRACFKGPKHSPLKFRQLLPHWWQSCLQGNPVHQPSVSQTLVCTEIPLSCDFAQFWAMDGV